MQFGMFMEFGMRQGGTHAEAFREGFELVDAAEEWGLDGAWLAELHFNPGRSVLASPITIASSIATRTKRMRVGMAVYVLPLNNPLRIAEEVCTVDQISEGRLELGIGRSGFPGAYDRYGISYNDSRQRFKETLEVLEKVWEGEPFSYQGEMYNFENVLVTPEPYQKPHPPIRIAATTAETFPYMGQQGRPIFVGLRGMNIPELSVCIKEYRKAWEEAGHPGSGDVSLRMPVYAGATEQRKALTSPSTVSAPILGAWEPCTGSRRAGPELTPPSYAAIGHNAWPPYPTIKCSKPRWPLAARKAWLTAFINWKRN